MITVLFLATIVALIAGATYLFLQQRKQSKEGDTSSTKTAVEGSVRKKVEKQKSELNQRDLFAEFVEQEGSGKPSPVTTPKESGSAVAVEPDADPVPASIPDVPSSVPAPEQIASPGITTAKQITDAPTAEVVTAQSIASPIPTDPATPTKDVQTAVNIPSPAVLPTDVTQTSQQSQPLEVEKTQAGSTIASSGEEVSSYESGGKKTGKRRKMLDKKKASKNAVSKTGSTATATTSGKKGKKQKKKKSTAKTE